MRKWFAAFFTVALAACMLAPAEAVYIASESRKPTTRKAKFVEGRIIVKPKAGLQVSALTSFNARRGAEVLRRFRAIGNLQVIQLPKGEKVLDAIAIYQRSGLVEYAEPDYIVEIRATHPDDTYYVDGTLWGLNNTGQDGGTDDADIDAPEGWDICTDASDVVVAVIDTGVRYTHQDLDANMWVNDDESVGDANSDGYPGVKDVDDDGDGLIDEDSEEREPGDPGYTNDLMNDDDENGYIDDIKGYDFCNDDNDPMDDHGHGTHCAGIIGAEGDNNTGVVGVAWEVQIMPLKFIGANGQGEISDAIACIDYAVGNGAHILSNSWGGDMTPGEISSLADAVRRAQSAGVIFVAAAGNYANDNDVIYDYPSGYGHAPGTGDIDNVVAVAATDREDYLAAWSCYGKESVDLGAPGVDIYSTYKYSDSSYKNASGTSMACPYVAGALALTKAEYPADDYLELIARVFQGVDLLLALEGKCATQGRLNLYGALTVTPVELFTTPQYGFVFGGPVGGPFVVDSRAYRLSNYSSSSVSWTASKTQSWLSISPTSGTLSSGESVLVEAWINSNGDSLSAGSYGDTITITNTSTGSGNTTRGVDLEVSSGPMYVATDGSNSNDGSSWAQAKLTVQAGIDAATPGQEVWVEQGIYQERISVPDGVTLYGGFSGSGSQRDVLAYKTVLDGTDEGRVVRALPETVFGCAEINGLTILGGNVEGSGGGVYLDRACAVVANNVIMGNMAFGYGGGISAWYSDSLIANNVIKSNSAYTGGAIDIFGGEHTVTNNTIVSNMGRGDGVVSMDYSDTTFANNIVAFNRAGVYAYLDDYSSVSFYNNDVYGNLGPLQYHLLEYDEEEDDYLLASAPTGTDGNISVDPLLADTAYGNLHIQSDSPCKNAGNNTYASGSYDIDLENRIQSSVVDIGADESDGSNWSSGPYIVVRVSSTDGDDDDDGSTWASAKETLGASMRDAALVGGEVWVEGGTYVERVLLMPYAYLYGGFAGTETSRSQRPAFPRSSPDSNESVIDGEDEDRAVTAFAIGQRVNTLDGFTITNGDGCSYNGEPYNGGGVVCYLGSPVVTNCKIVGNAAYTGGGVYCRCSYAEFIGNVISQNEATTGYGGGVFCKSFRGQILSNTISENETSSLGGGIYDEGNGGEYANNLIVGNQASSGGGAFLEIGDTLFTNNTVVDNTATSESGGGVRTFDCYGVVSNNIIAFNNSGIDVQPSIDEVTLINNDVYGNTEYNYSQGTTPGATDIQQDPLFVDRQNDDYHIQSSSPCRDAGDDDYARGAFDMDRQPRIQEDSVDMGGDEYSAVILVSPDGDDVNDGRTWETAKLTVEDAIDDASSGEEIWVAEGTYEENIDLTEGVSLYGGFTGDEGSRTERDPEANETILDGDESGSVVTSPSSITTATVIDGFTITNGSGTDWEEETHGGGIFCDSGSSPTISGNTITSNTADCGGGIFVWPGGGSPVIEDNVITNNDAHGLRLNSGSAIVRRNTITSNDAGVHCVSSSATISNNIIAGHTGKGVHCQNGTPLIVADNLIYDNNPGIFCIFASPTIANNTISDNAGSGAYQGGVIIEECSPTLSNNIITYNTVGVKMIIGDSPTLNYNDVYGNTTNYSGLSAGANDISSDPLFVDRNNDDYHIGSSSPCRDAGSDDYVVGPYDIDQEPRIQGTVDMGADEYAQALMVSPAGDDANDGRTWETAKLTIQDAIDTAASGEEVWVVEGAYEENITLKEGVSVYGGFAGDEGSRDERSPETNETILDGGEDGSVVTAPSGVTTATVIDGFTITNGSAQHSGGGVRCYMSSPTITHNVIVDNTCTYNGGGVYILCGSPVIKDNTITLNSANNGAGVYDEGFYPVISGNTITENTATNYGGGISCFIDVMPSITNNIIVDNSAAYGGGIDCRYDCWAVIVNNTIYDNAASTNGGGISIYDSCPTITNNIVVSNSSGIYSDDSSPSVDYNDVYNNTSYNYSGLSAGANDISSAPSFVNAGQGDYHLQSGSPCIDSGTNTGAPATDKDGVTRPQDGDGSPPAVCDMGAYELPES